MGCICRSESAKAGETGSRKNAAAFYA